MPQQRFNLPEPAWAVQIPEQKIRIAETVIQQGKGRTGNTVDDQTQCGDTNNPRPFKEGLHINISFTAYWQEESGIIMRADAKSNQPSAVAKILLVRDEDEEVCTSQNDPEVLAGIERCGVYNHHNIAGQLVKDRLLLFSGIWKSRRPA